MVLVLQTILQKQDDPERGGEEEGISATAATPST
jgi:hypothetical protein